MLSINVILIILETKKLRAWEEIFVKISSFNYYKLALISPLVIVEPLC